MLLPPEERYRFRAEPLERIRAANAAVGNALSAHPRLIFVNPMAVLADEQGRVPVFTPQRQFISQDRTHFTRAGAIWVGMRLLEHPAIAALAAEAGVTLPAGE